MSQEVKNYEFAYLLSPSVEEGAVLSYTAKISALIEEAGGMVRKTEAPKRRQLAYPVRKEHQAYFGWTTFTATPLKTKELEKKFSGLKEILRHLLIEAEIEKRPPTFRPMHAMTGAGRVVRPPAREAEKADDKLDLEALDKKLEEILGK